MYIFARSRTRVSSRPPTHYEFDRLEFVFFLVRMMLLLGGVAVILSTHGVH